MATPGAKPNIIAARTDPNQNSRPDPGAAAGTITELLPPDELSPEGKKLWAIITPALLTAKILREEDVVLLIEMVECAAMTRRFRQELLAEEITFGLGSAEAKRLRTGYVQMLKATQSLAADYGISPVARVRLGLMQAGGASLQDLVGQHGPGMQPDVT